MTEDKKNKAKEILDKLIYEMEGDSFQYYFNEKEQFCVKLISLPIPKLLINITVDGLIETPFDILLCMLKREVCNLKKDIE